jgi:aminopeptidase N
MLVSESLLARMADPDDDFVAVVCAHEVSHLWFGCHISSRWWDDLWLDEAMASYVSYLAMAEAGMADPWTALSYREKPQAYEADALPGRQPMSSPVATAADALSRPVALTYSKGTAVIRQLAALIGDDALRAGLADYMRRFGGGTASLDDLIGCWSRSSGRDLSGWAQEWLRTEGASTLRASVEAGADGTLAALAVEQDEPRTHRLGIGLYDRSGPGSVLRRRRVISAEVSGARCEIPVPPGEPVPAAVVPNDGDLTYAQISFEPATLEALAEAAMNTGDPMTEAACWNAAWRMVTSGALSGADLAGLVTRRLAGSPPLPAVGLEVLLGWAVTAADLYTADTERGGARAALATASLAGAGAAAGEKPSQRWRPDSQPARTPAISGAGARVAGRRAAAARLDLDGDLRGRCCARWRPAGSPPMRTWTRWPPRTRWPGAEPGGLPGRAAGRRGQGSGVATGARRRGPAADGGGGERAVGTRPGGAAGRVPGPVLRRGAARAGRAGHPPDAAAGPGAVPGHAGRARDADGDRVGSEA